MRPVMFRPMDKLTVRVIKSWGQLKYTALTVRFNSSAAKLCSLLAIVSSQGELIPPG